MSYLTEDHIRIYQAIHDGNEPRVYDQWHASAIAECPRAHYFKRLGVPAVSEPSAAKMLRWQAGHSLEEAIRPHLEQLYPDMKSNIRIVDEHFDLTGEYDNYSEENKLLIEIKSVHDYAIIERNGVNGLKEKTGVSDNGRNQWGLKGDPYLHHQLQNHAYYLLLGRKPEQILYVYLTLSGRVITYLTPINEHITRMVVSRLEILNKAWAKQEPPECMCDQQDHPLWGPVMQWCDYKEEHDCCSLQLIEKGD